MRTEIRLRGLIEKAHDGKTALVPCVEFGLGSSVYQRMAGRDSS